MDATPHPTPTQSGATEKEQSKSSQDPRFSESPFKLPPQYLNVDGDPLLVCVCVHRCMLVEVGQEVLCKLIL